MGNFLFIWSLHIVGRKVLTPPVLWRSPILSTPSFFKFCPTTLPIPTTLPPLTATPTVLSVVLFLWLNEWSCHTWCAILLNDVDLHVLSLCTVVPEGPLCVFYVTRCQIYWGLTHNVVLYWYSDLISHTQTYKRTHHTQGPVDWHTHISIYLHHLLCVNSSYLYYIKWLNE